MATLAELSTPQELRFNVEQRAVKVPLSELLEWGEPAPLRSGMQVILADGSVLLAEPFRLENDQFTVDSLTAGTPQFNLGALAGILFSPAVDTETADREYLALLDASGEGDRLLLINGDELTGRLLGFSSEQLRFETELGPLEIPTSDARSLILDPTLRSRPDAEPHLWVGLTDGSRLRLTHVEPTSTGLRGTCGGVPLEIPLDEVVHLLPVGQGGGRYLADLEAGGYRHVPFLSTEWPYQRDRSVGGTLLRSGGRLYLKGLGMHSASRLTYTLRPGDRRLEALLAIDDAAGEQGNVRFRVFVDTEERFASEIIRSGDAPRPISVDLTGGRTVSLIIDYAQRGDTNDWANWLGARLTGE